VGRILVTGFEPFGGSEVNVSKDVVDLLPSSLVLDDPWAEIRSSPLNSKEVELETCILSVDQKGSQTVSQRIQRGERWDAILHVGVCGTCTVPRLEQVAADLLDMRIPDNAGRQVKSSTLSGKGDLMSSAPISIWMQNWDTDATSSVDAGSYLCNETLYRTLEVIAPGDTPCLFLHLPPEEKYSIEKSRFLLQQTLARLAFRPVLDVVGALFIKDGKFLLARRAPHEDHAGTWEFPGGKVEPGESLKTAICREIEEEFGWKTVADAPIGTWHHELASFQIALHVMPCSIEGLPPQFDYQKRWTSHDAIEWHTVESCEQLIFTGSDQLIVEALISGDLLS